MAKSDNWLEWEENGFFYLSTAVGGNYYPATDDGSLGRSCGPIIWRFMSAEGRQYFILLQESERRTAALLRRHNTWLVDLAYCVLKNGRFRRKRLVDLAKRASRLINEPEGDKK